MILDFCLFFRISSAISRLFSTLRLRARTVWIFWVVSPSRLIYTDISFFFDLLFEAIARSIWLLTFFIFFNVLIAVILFMKSFFTPAFIILLDKVFRVLSILLSIALSTLRFISLRAFSDVIVETLLLKFNSTLYCFAVAIFAVRIRFLLSILPFSVTSLFIDALISDREIFEFLNCWMNAFFFDLLISNGFKYCSNSLILFVRFSLLNSWMAVSIFLRSWLRLVLLISNCLMNTFFLLCVRLLLWLI